jgi:hypothetical protein
VKEVSEFLLHLGKNRVTDLRSDWIKYSVQERQERTGMRGSLHESRHSRDAVSQTGIGEVELVTDSWTVATIMLKTFDIVEGIAGGNCLSQ